MAFFLFSVISPTFETKPFPNVTSNTSRRKLDIQSKLVKNILIKSFSNLL